MDILNPYMSVPIVAVCFVIGYVIKNSAIFGRIPNQNIPLICTLAGVIFGLIMIGFNADGIIIGAVSGLASTGIHQMRTQFCELVSDKEAENDDALETQEDVAESEGDEDE